MKITFPLAAALLLSAGAAAAHDHAPLGSAENPRELSYSATLGTLGFGAEVAVPVNETLQVRVVQNGVRTSGNYTLEGTEFEYDARIASYGLMVDWHPTGEKFRISAGARRNRIMGADLTANLGDSFTYGGTSYSFADDTIVSGRIEAPEYAPVATFGWKGDIRENVSLLAEFGVMYVGTPTVTLDSEGGASGDASFDAELENQRQAIEDTLGRLGVYPIAQLGVSVRF
jgi:hypothetical protein